MESENTTATGYLDGSAPVERVLNLRSWENVPTDDEEEAAVSELTVPLGLCLSSEKCRSGMVDSCDVRLEVESEPCGGGVVGRELLLEIGGVPPVELVLLVVPAFSSLSRDSKMLKQGWQTRTVSLAAAGAVFVVCGLEVKP